MAAARHRAVDWFAASLDDLGSQPANFGLVGRTHLGPHLTWFERSQNAVVIFEHGRADRGTGQTGNHEVDLLGHSRRRLAPLGPSVEQRLGRRPVKVANRQVDAVAKQAASKLGANVSESNESNAHRSPYKV